MEPITTMGITALLKMGERAIDAIFPDQELKARQMLELEKLAQDGQLEKLRAEVQLMLAQIEVNKEQAKSKSFFVAGARPAVIWIGALSIAYQFIVYPLLIWVWAYAQAIGYVSADLQAPPVIDSTALFAMVSALLGVGGMRSYDKSKGTQTDKI